MKSAIVDWLWLVGGLVGAGAVARTAFVLRDELAGDGWLALALFASFGVAVLRAFTAFGRLWRSS